MARLTNKERASFTADKLAELDRMSTDRQDKFLEPDGVKDEDKSKVRANIVGKWANMTSDQLKMRVNIDSFGDTITYSKDNNYSKQEQEAIGYAWKSNAGRKAQVEIPAILAQNQEMITDGIDANTRKAILKARGGK